MNNNIELVELNKICNINSGGTPSRKKTSYFGGKIKWAKISDLEKAGDGYIYDTDEKITAEGLNNIRNKIFENGTLFLAMYGSVGKTAITKNEMSCNQAILGITAKNENDLDLKFLKYWLDSKKKELLNSAKGVALKNLSAGMVKKLKIPLPPLSTQKRIAEILDNATALRDKTKQLLTEYDQLAQSIFLDMFGDPVTNPKGWKKNKTIDYCDCIVPGRDKPKSFTGDIPWVTTNDLNHLDFTEKSKLGKGLSAEEISQVKAKIIPENSIIITCVGDLGVVSINTKKMVVNQQLHTFQCSDKLNNVFLMFNLSFQKPYMYKMASSTTVPYMNKTIANGIPTIVPPIRLQNQFAEKIALIEQQKDLAKQELQESEDLFQALLQKAFKGGLN